MMESSNGRTPPLLVLGEYPRNAHVDFRFERLSGFERLLVAATEERDTETS